VIVMLRIVLLGLCLGVAGCATQPAATVAASAGTAATAETVAAAERAFAATMAARDFDRFASFIADDAVFINSGKPLRGKAAILAHWKQFYAPPGAPFAWAPEIAELSDGGRLGYTEGPVSGADGKVFARFYSTWQLKPDGRWLIVFDNGYLTCDCRAPK